ncbi:MAG: hypothetical protein IAE89_08430 [Anaerolineae bacterium]|nr:hypothetical protein [Anaerolineae bacterium]
MITLLLAAIPAFAQDNATSTAQAATESIRTLTVMPVLPTLTDTPTPAPPTVVPTQVPTRMPTATPQITGELIADTGARVIFPDAVEFFSRLAESVDAGTPIRLEIAGENFSEPVVVDGTAADFQTEDDAAQLLYRWRVELENAPVLFDTITYRWAISVGDTASGEVKFTDSRAEWIAQRAADGGLLLMHSGRHRARLSSNLEQLYRLLQDLTGESPRFQFMIYEDGLRPACSEDSEICQGDAYSDVYRRSGYIPVIASEALELDLARWIVLGFYAPNRADANVPDWWLEGLSRFLLPMATPQMLLASQTAERAGQTFTLEEMLMRPEAPISRRQWDAQAYGMVMYILNTIGRDGLFMLAEMPESTFAESYLLATGQDINTLIPGWSRWIFSENAAAVYGITPYMADTPIPSATPTPTLTWTLSPTPTLTASPTLTPTPDLRTQTEPPTITPMPSATDSPPTATPRSINVLLTPEPQASNSASIGESDIRTIVGGTLVLLIAALVALFALSMRRK